MFAPNLLQRHILKVEALLLRAASSLFSCEVIPVAAPRTCCVGVPCSCIARRVDMVEYEMMSTDTNRVRHSLGFPAVSLSLSR